MMTAITSQYININKGWNAEDDACYYKAKTINKTLDGLTAISIYDY